MNIEWTWYVHCGKNGSFSRSDSMIFSVITVKTAVCSSEILVARSGDQSWWLRRPRQSRGGNRYGNMIGDTSGHKLA